LKSGQKRLDEIIGAIKFAVDNKLLTERQVIELKKILLKIQLSR